MRYGLSLWLFWEISDHKISRIRCSNPNSRIRCSNPNQTHLELCERSTTLQGLVEKKQGAVEGAVSLRQIASVLVRVRNVLEVRLLAHLLTNVHWKYEKLSLTHYLLGDLNEVLDKLFSNWLYWLMTEGSLVKLPLDGYQWTLPMISQHGFK